MFVEDSWKTTEEKYFALKVNKEYSRAFLITYISFSKEINKIKFRSSLILSDSLIKLTFRDSQNQIASSQPTILQSQSHAPPPKLNGSTDATGVHNYRKSKYHHRVLLFKNGDLGFSLDPTYLGEHTKNHFITGADHYTEETKGAPVLAEAQERHSSLFNSMSSRIVCRDAIWGWAEREGCIFR